MVTETGARTEREKQRRPRNTPKYLERVMEDDSPAVVLGGLGPQRAVEPRKKKKERYSSILIILYSYLNSIMYTNITIETGISIRKVNFPNLTSTC